MQSQFLTFVNEQRLFSPTDSVLLAVSGGIDSVVLVDLFQRQGFRYGIAHVNFGLRGRESDADEAFVRALAAANGVEFHGVRFDTLSEAARAGISVQMAARTLRYAWFQRLAADFSYSCVATAHHLDDSLETVLLNLVRGTGLAGLKGIPVRNGNVVRPLLFAGRGAVEQYAADRALAWREDQSNTEDKYARNRLRHQVVPVLKALNPNLLQTMQPLWRAVAGAEAVLTEALSHSWEALRQEQDGHTLVPLEPLRALTGWEFRLGAWLSPYGFRTAQWRAIEEAVRGTGFGQVFESESHRLLRDRAFLVIAPKTAQQRPWVDVPGPGAEAVWPPTGERLTAEVWPRAAFSSLKTDADTVLLDAAAVRWPLRVRRWQAADRFRPLGLTGTQTVSDFLTNQKVSRLDRDRTLVLLSGEQIAWVVGWRLDHAFRVTAATTEILRVTRKKNGPQT